MNPPASSSPQQWTSVPRIILIRHGRPDIPVSPRTCQAGFRDYIGQYEAAGLNPQDTPPEELQDLVGELAVVFTSEKRRAQESAKALAPGAELIIDPLFAEAPLAGPPLPLLRMRVTKWAVVARVLWYAGYHPGIENYRKAKHRASEAADVLVRRAASEGSAALVAHGYFNFLIGRELYRRGFRRSGSHRARFWNVVAYERKPSAGKP
jgi:broad specificity phosphatase PhoE